MCIYKNTKWLPSNLKTKRHLTYLTKMFIVLFGYISKNKIIKIGCSHIHYPENFNTLTTVECI